MGDENEQTIVISDLLSFISCKINILPKYNLIKCIRDFYTKQDIEEALKTFFSSLPEEQLQKYQRKCKGVEPLLLLCSYFKTHNENLPVFVCKNLNNIPKADCDEYSNFEKDHQDLLSEQKVIKSQISEISSIVYQLKDQIQLLTQCKNNVLKVKNKGLAYLQKLIDEEESEKEKRSLHSVIKEELEDEFGISEYEDDGYDNTEDEETLDLRANRSQRALSKYAENKNLKPERQKLFPVPEFGEEGENQALFDQRIIHIGSEDIESVDNKPEVNSSVEDDTEIQDDVASHSEDSSSAMSIADNEFDEDKFPNIVVEQVFDEHVGHFSVYKCSLCNFSTNDISAVQQHDCPQNYHEDPDEVADDGSKKPPHYFCLHCRFRCKTKLLFKRHTQIHPQSYPCPFCGEKHAESETWTNHVAACVTSSDRDQANHICQVCGIVYANASAMTVHKGFHDVAKPFECLKCKFRYYTQDTLNRHFNSHIINGFKCPFCLFVNKNKTTLATHIRCHTGEMPFACLYCDYKSSSQGALTSHAFSHSDKRTIQCDECPSLFKTIHKLKAHKTTHINCKLHKCPACFKTFKTGSLMKIHHQRIHLDLRPFACDLCSYKARNSSSLKQHQSTHLNQKPFQCAKCDFRANHKGYLRRHLNTSHLAPPKL